jgi:hypothetical protein
MNFKTIKHSICYVLMLTVNVMMLQSLMVSTAAAAPVCSAYGANSPTPECTTVKAGSTVVAVPRMTWTLVSEDVVAQSQRELASLGGTRNALNGNYTAELSMLASSQVASAVNSFPANVPMVVGRYEPMSRTLRVDIFKIERTMRDGQPRSALYQSTFSPAYGGYWKAMGTYLSPEARRTGNAVGPDPFASFARGGSDMFHDITQHGAMVVLGHAQRYVGSPVSLLIDHFPEHKTTTTKSGNIFRKKVTTTVDFSAKPHYYLGAPMGMQGGTQYAFCASNPQADSCPAFESASSGVGFMKLTGGNLIDNAQFVHQWSHTEKGWTLLAVFVIAFVFAFAAAAIAPTLSAAVATGAGSAAPTLGAGFWTNMLSMTGVGGTTAVSAAALEAGLYTAVTAAAGSGFGGVYGTGGSLVYAQEKAYAPPTEPEHESARQYRDKMLNQGMATGTVEQAIQPVRSQLTGNCGTGVLLKDCTGSSGILPRGDGYLDFKGVEFMRDNGGPRPAGSQ